MKIEVGNLLKKTGKETAIRGEADVSFPADEVNIRGPVKYDLKLVNVGGSILVTGTLKANVVLACVRCLKDFESTVSVDVEEQYGKETRVRGPKAEEVELKEKDFTFNIEEEGVIDLTEAIRQNFITALPIKPLCWKACKGVEGSACLPARQGMLQEKKGDPRLSKLKDLLKK